LPEQEKWKVDEAFAERSRFKEYNRKHPREYAACFSNLSHLIDLLQQFGAIKAFQVGFLKSEGQGVYRIGQTGVKHARETRLYVHVDETAKVARVLTIGDKDSQSDDIRRCHATATKIKCGV
jgi:hypothetical protein